MAVVLKDNKLIFTYKIVPGLFCEALPGLLTYFLGTAQKSYGIEVATLAGLPSQV
jgi:DNA mismatch repair ATPase MutS